MSDQPLNNSNFIKQAESILLENISNEQFGVSELANAMHMSRSNLLRKIKKQTQLSASQYIRQIRLKESIALLNENSLTISEISHQVGFGSTSYFIKCFREHYGHPPGEIGKVAKINTEKVEAKSINNYKWPLLILVSVGILIGLFLHFGKNETKEQVTIEKSIAVLPFKNESNDSTNIYFVNGLMESALNNLQKIEDLRVISRTSVEKYRASYKGVPEIASELNVNYIVEGSGQRIDNQVLLTVQLIEAATDTPIWAEQYNQEVVNIFTLQNDIAKKIAAAIKAVVTPAELEQIEKKPTNNLLAYDLYLQALEPYNSRSKEGLEKAIELLKKAVELDSQFAHAYAKLAISYYFLDEFQKQKHYTEIINNYADKALLYDTKSDVSLIAKALYYMHTEEYRLALPHLEKALEYNPNSNAVVQVLSSLYSNFIPNTAKYLKYALMGVKLDIAANDSISKSYIYLNLSNALAQSGFTEEAMTYINQSLDYDPNNYYAPYAKAYIQYAKDGNLEQTKKSLIRELYKDSTRLDIMQEIGKLNYFQEDYKSAYKYYDKFSKTKEKLNLNIYPHENLKIGYVYERMGFKDKSATFYNAYAAYCKNDKSIYKSASTAMLYAHEGKIDEAIEQLNIFATQDHYQYWVLLFIEKDPLISPLKSHPNYNKTIQKIKDRFWENQAKLKSSLEKNDLL
ncbi:helix-turn-helix domain-containing protein [Aurantibacter crassamenti]|uniref:helix-turn-helix domain-containing protein n=1 Tax=Aurantibacter crassamenti TaxID=1837375 RepID=UPI0019395E72|nr:helix-turn-helix domain-containing protein [Aurantibacter crassamenti]MBM1105680.1 helix-turn-helix domain-containing protein [Aurantibacter crassamenti]